MSVSYTHLDVYTRARPGYRTLIDALQPFVEALKAGKGPRAAAQAAHDGAEKTRKMDALVGRASYVAKEELRKLDSEGGLPDPGAVGPVSYTHLDVYKRQA